MAEGHPHEPHWYLNVVSTLPVAGRARASAPPILQPVLAEADAEGWPCYLESSNPRNVSLYLRHGFVETGELPLPDGPSLIQMWREPHAADRVTRTSEAHPYDGPLMASISRDEVAHVAKLARLQLTDEQLDTFTPQLAAILEHAADVEALDLADVPPTVAPVPAGQRRCATTSCATPASATRCWPRPRRPRTACSACPPVLGEAP